MFSSSVDRKQFHLHENSLPHLPPLPQHHLLLFLPSFHSSGTSAGFRGTTLSFVILHSIFSRQKEVADPQQRGEECSAWKRDINERLVHELQARPTLNRRPRSSRQLRVLALAGCLLLNMMYCSQGCD